MFAVDEIIYCCVYFIVTLVGWQALLLWAYPQSPVFWKRVDYYWLAVAFIGVITAVQAYSIDEKKKHTESAELAFTQEYKYIESILLAGIKNNCDPLRFVDCSWYVNQLKQFHLPTMGRNQSRTLTAKFEYAFDFAPRSLNKDVLRKLADALPQYNRKLVKLVEAEKEEDARIIWKEFASYAPAFLIGLLTLRITKVTADSMMEQDRDRTPSRFKKGPPHWFERKKCFVGHNKTVTGMQIFLTILCAPFFAAAIILGWRAL